MGADASPPRRHRARSRSRSPARPRSRWEREDEDDDGDGGNGAARRAAAPAPAAAAAARRARGADDPYAARGGGGGGAGGGGNAIKAGRWRREDDAADAAAAQAAATAPPPPPPPPAPLFKPDFNALSGKLAAEANTVNGVVLKFAPPAEARVCKSPRWRVYVFKDLPPRPAAASDDDDDEKNKKKKQKKHQEPVGEPIPLDRYPYYLFGKERRVADIPTDHESCSRQHAVVCFREVERLPEGGLLPASAGSSAAAALAASRQTLPYLVDLETANGTLLNGERVEPGRFYELLDGDVVRFGASTREYVFIREPQ